MSLAQRAMQHPMLAPIYERAWRPVGFLTAMGFDLPHFLRERDKAIAAMRLSPGDVVVDVACGPGNFTRAYAAAVGPSGRAVGVDLSEPMIARALVDNADTRASYLLGSGHRLPFPDGSVDAAACYGALYLIPDPFRVVDEMIRVLRPGGRIALMAAQKPGRDRLDALMERVAAPAGLQMFDRHELPTRLRAAGFTEITQETHGVLQYVAATR